MDRADLVLLAPPGETWSSDETIRNVGTDHDEMQLIDVTVGRFEPFSHVHLHGSPSQKQSVRKGTLFDNACYLTWLNLVRTCRAVDWADDLAPVVGAGAAAVMVCVTGLDLDGAAAVGGADDTFG